VPSVQFIASNRGQAQEMAEVVELLQEAGVPCELLSEVADADLAGRVGAAIVITTDVEIAAVCKHSTSAFVIIAPMTDHVDDAKDLAGAATIESGSLIEAAGFALRVLGIRPEL
jgi:hypothetical protein